jgi:hypothetical protein
MKSFAFSLGLYLAVHASVCTGDPALHVTYDERGVASINQNGHVLMAPEDARVKVAYFRASNPEDEKGFDQIFNPKPESSSFDAASRTLTQTFLVAELRVRWHQPEPRRLDVEVVLANKAKRPIVAKLLLGCLRLNRNRRVMDAGRRLGTGKTFSHPAGVLAVLPAAGEHGTPLTLGGLNGKPVLNEDGDRLARGTLTVETGFGRKAKHPIVDNHWFDAPGSELPAGEQTVWTFSLVAGDEADPLPTVPEKRREGSPSADPMVLEWPDRRPIGTIFWSHPNKHWKTNPRGFNFGKGAGNDVFTEAGRRDFADALFAYVDRCVEQCRVMKAQGVIIWNLEGEEFWHPVSYLGDPRILPKAAPEMDALADDVFKRLRDAGLKTGCTVRPTELYRKKTEGKGTVWSHRDVRDPVKLISDKIAYAKERWGCSLFYLDSNVFGEAWGAKLPKGHNVPWVMPTKMLAAIQQAHPDVLVIPEWSRRSDYRYGAPYSSPNNRQMCTPPEIREKWPEAFRVVAVQPRIMQENWNNYLNGVGGGDILLFPCWYSALENAFVEAVYEEAALRKTQPPQVVGAKPAELPGLLDAPNDAVRYHTVLRLAEQDTEEAMAALVRATRDRNVLVQRVALEMLARCKPRDSSLVARLVAIVENDSRELRAILRPFAADALGACGETAVPALAEMLRGKDAHVRPYAVRAMARTGTRDEKAISALLTALGTTWDRKNRLQEPIIKALGHLQAEAAVPVLIQFLDARERDSEFVRLAAVRALGQIGDRRAVAPLIKHTGAHYSTVAVYSIKHVLDDALANLTGEQGIVGGREWRQWQEK